MPKKSRKKPTPNPEKKLRRLSRFYLWAGGGLMIIAFVAILFPKGPFETTAEPVGKLPLAADRTSGTKNKAWEYFHPVWTKSNFLLASDEAKQSKPVEAPGLLLGLPHIVRDPEGKLDPGFEITKKLFGRVLFWVNVFGLYDTRMRIIHDRYQPSIIYGYLDFRPLFEKITDKNRRLRKMRRIEKAVLTELKSRIRETSGLSKSDKLDGFEKGQLASFLSSVGIQNKSQAQQAVLAIRTQTGQRDMFLKAINRSQDFLPHIKSVFKEKKLPLVLAHIPFVESSFNPRAHSKTGAMGIWQFMVPTAREMISRNDPSKWSDPLIQTKAAARLLRMYRSLLPDWSTTVTSYNSGVGRLQRLVKKHQAKHMDKLLEDPKENGLGFAGENFYAEVLAVTLVASYKHRLFEQYMIPNQLTQVLKTKKASVR